MNIKQKNLETTNIVLPFKTTWVKCPYCYSWIDENKGTSQARTIIHKIDGDYCPDCGKQIRSIMQDQISLW